MAQYRALPLAAAPEALRRWLQAPALHRRSAPRTNPAGILTAWRSRTPTTPTATNAADNAAAEAGIGPAALLAAGAATAPASSTPRRQSLATSQQRGGPSTLPGSRPGRLLRGAVGRVQSATAAVTRIPAVSSVIQAGQDNPGLSQTAGVIILVVIAGATLVGSQPTRPDAAIVTSPAAATPAPPGAGPTQSAPLTPTGSPTPSPNTNQPTTPATRAASSTNAGPPPPPRHDFSVNINATDLTNAVFGVVDAVNGTGATSLNSHQVQTLHLAAGPYILFSGLAVVEFAVTSTGTVDYGPASSFLAGRGSTTLVAHGRDITIDAHECPTRHSASPTRQPTSTAGHHTPCDYSPGDNSSAQA